jgi:hypothetical protein
MSVEAAGPPFVTMKLASAEALPDDREPAWSTASFGHAPDTSPLELSTLGDHLDRCSGRSGRWFVLRCRVEALQAFMSSHIVTTLVVALLVGAALLAV